MTFIKLDHSIVELSTIEYIDDTCAEMLLITVHHKHGVDTASGFYAIELLWLIKPSALEGKRFHWRKHAWSIHNLFAHPIMQLLAYCRLYKWAIWIHDKTAPQPKIK